MKISYLKFVLWAFVVLTVINYFLVSDKSGVFNICHWNTESIIRFCLMDFFMTLFVALFVAIGEGKDKPTDTYF